MSDGIDKSLKRSIFEPIPSAFLVNLGLLGKQVLALFDVFSEEVNCFD